MSSELLLIDLSSIVYPAWHVSGSDPDPDAVSVKSIAKVRALACSHPHAAICCDSGKSFRAEVDPTYKQQREAKPAALFHQIDRAIEALRADGFPIWQCKGFEADDVISTATHEALDVMTEDPNGHDVLICSSDKDLLALVGPRVRVKSLSSGAVLGEAEVREKFGVKPEQMTDYLCLVGDASDNIKGAKGIGPKKAAELLGLYISLDFLYAALDDKTAILTPAVNASLLEFRERLPVVRQLVTMRTDCPINLADAFKERVATDAQGFSMEDDTMSQEMFPPETHELPRPSPVGLHGIGGRPSNETHPVPDPSPTAGDPPQPTTSGTPQPLGEQWRPTGEPQTLTPAGHDTEAPGAVQLWTPAPAPFAMQLEPRSMGEATKLAEWAFKARLFSAYGTPQAVLCCILAGREHGLQAMASLRSYHVIEGRLSASADLMVALVLRSGLAEYFRPVSFDAKQATFETLRKGNGNQPVQFQYTIEMAVLAGLVKEKGNWLKSPLQMNVSRSKSTLSRLVYPDVLAGMYTPEELQEMGE